MSQFAFLAPEFAAVHDHARKAEAAALNDPRAACFYGRLALETAIKWLYDHDRTLRKPYEETLAALIHEPSFRALAGDGLVTKAKLIKDLGNRAVHDTRPVNGQSAITVLRELFHVSYWLVHTYARGEKPAASLSFSADALPRTAQVDPLKLGQLQEAARRYMEQVEARQKAEAEALKSEDARAELEAEIRRLQAEVAATKAANQARPDAHDYNEAQTRDAYIDLLLSEAGWPLAEGRDREYPVRGIPSASGDGFADYVLWGDDHKPLAVIEAKRTRKDPRAGQQQAKLYADALEAEFGVRPVIFYTNGYDTWLWDDLNHPPRRVQGFLKKDELALMHQRRTSRKPLASVAIDGAIAGRYYQTRAIQRVGEAFERDHQRKALLVMATGTGKTRTVIALVDQLMRANRVKRALFLADRVALVNQAVGAFKTHLPHTSPVNLITDKQAEGRIYFSTYPTMMGLIDEMQNGIRRFGPGHFDLIVIDEAHRSVYQKYRAIFDYFDGLLVGLTATPRDEIDRDTYSLFQLQSGVPTDAYDLEQAVSDGFLVPPKAISVPLRFQRHGIRYDDLSEAEKEQWDLLEWDEDGTIPTDVNASDINKWLFNTDTVDKVLAHLMTHGLKVEGGDRLGKTIIFAKNSAHAAFIVERFDANYPHLKGEFARLIDYSVSYAQSLIDDFSNPARAPQIAVSVDMLDTGIDVPEVVNLVFFKIVRSKTKFWQMIGRGTRLRPDLFGPGQDKAQFLIFDFCQNFEFFNQNPEYTEGGVTASLGQRLFTARVDLIGLLDRLPDGDDSLRQLRADTQARLHAEVAGMNRDNFLVRPKWRHVERFQAADAWETIDEDARHILSDEIAGLPSAFEDDDLGAKQFDYLVLSAQLALLRQEAAFARCQERIRSLAGQLESLSNIPMVQAELHLIMEVQTDDYWRDVTPAMLEQVRRRLRLLIKLIEGKARAIIYTDFEDEIGEGEEIALPVEVGTDKERFQRKVRHFLKDHADHITILKLRRNEQLTAQDVTELERILLEQAALSSADLQQVKAEGGLGLFIRSLVGLDREAAKQAFATFIASRALNADQIEFLDLIINHLTAEGVMEARRLYESPFTDMDDQGVSGLFQSADVIALIHLLEEVKAKAAA
ncbi:DEAD/DEAH box helicase family protein [Asticcacaulis sp.]|uniref:DEAD/DEAH box helicase family protein n=1 Tax=Asticcacaulis sp. TaxID=1872648 RepID=UPI003F7CC0B2